jgi:hypothetical protein
MQLPVKALKELIPLSGLALKPFVMSARLTGRHHAAGCPTDVRHELLGHEKKTVAAGYGVGHPMPLLKSGLIRSAFRFRLAADLL